jgi:hypothetical protein
VNCSGSGKLARGEIVHTGNCPDCGGRLRLDDSRVVDHRPRPSTMGRDDYLMEQLAKRLQKDIDLWGDDIDTARLDRADSRRGYRFDVRVRVAGELTGHIARVTVELDRLEQT